MSPDAETRDSPWLDVKVRVVIDELPVFTVGKQVSSEPIALIIADLGEKVG